MSAPRERFFVAFDISDNRRRRRLVKILEEFGARTQYSIFEFYLTPARKREFMAQLQREKFLVKDKSDEALIIIPIPQSLEKRIRRYGTTSRVYDEPHIAIF